MLFHINLVVCISILVFSCDKFQEQVDKQRLQKLAEQQKKEDACREFLKTPQNIRSITKWQKKLKAKPEYNHMLYQCPQLFFKTFTIGDRKKFLGPAQFKKYQQDLDNQNCKQAEQILYKKYQVTYSRTPQINFDEKHNHNLGAWRRTVLISQAPETLLCLSIKKISAAQKIIETKKLPTQPIRNLRKLNNKKIKTEIELERIWGLRYLVSLAIIDYPPAHIEIIKLSMKGHIFRLRDDQHYRLLKRLDFIGKLPPELQKEYIIAKSKLSEKTIKAINKRVMRKYFYLLSMPTTALEIK